MFTADVIPASALYETLRERILDQTEAPGASVTEASVVLQFGVARPTAKLAIERLVADGLLRRERHHAARVPDLSRDDIVDLYDARALVEPEAMAALARGGRIPSAALEAHRALLDSTRTGRSIAREDAAFHRALVAAQPSPRLTRLHDLLMGEIELCIGQVQANHLLSSGLVAEQHQGILDAVTAGNADLARGRALGHIENARDALLTHYDATH
ncbi:MAG: GntR family transcriptional regulator [Pseudolysinimonas sp.]|uniref:GntR family transcriptional regulator n=1 Tax=Pseudolysinimonas sp. TaxID=2680009 RepID=UPI0032653A47